MNQIIKYDLRFPLIKLKKAPPEAGLRFEISLPNRVGWHGLRTWVQIHSDLNTAPENVQRKSATGRLLWP